MLETDTGRAVLLKGEQIPGEYFYVDQKIKVFVMEVNKESRGPLVTLSRVHPALVRRMFELEVPEIQDGIVIVKGVAREPGQRTKIAIYSEDPMVDAIGACVGNKGARVNAIVSELGGEKIDIIQWSENPLEYISRALSPARVVKVVETGDESAMAVVPDDKLSLAIGRSGQNARLAVRLTGWKIDVKSESAVGADLGDVVSEETEIAE